MYPLTIALSSSFFLVCCHVVQTSLATTFVLQDSAHNRVARASNSTTPWIKEYDPNCDARWTSIDPNHTMCLVDVGQEVVLDQATKDALLQQHNALRGQVDPPAANMPMLVWDDELAEVAAKLARQCAAKHDTDPARRVPSLPGVSVGQNIAAGFLLFAEGVQAWFDEYKDFVYGVGSTGGVVTHYTQMVAARTQRVGCGQAVCRGSRFERYYICNYAAFQLEQDTIRPYSNSTSSCSACPDKCDASGKLCDCGDKMCLNRGQLNIATCSCICPTRFQGDRCQTAACPPDHPVCGTVYSSSYCGNMGFRTRICPNMCGACPPQVS